jgi:hypothetical protein
MAEADFTQTDSETRKVIFKPFSWHHEKANSQQTFNELTQDISRGVANILEMIEVSELYGDPTNHRAVLSAHDCGILMRLAISSMKLLGDAAEDKISFANK